MTKWQLWELGQLFPYMAFVYAWIVPIWADQILPQLLMEQFDTLLIQWRHIEHMHEGVYIFLVCTDSTEIFFSKLSSAALNYNFISFFADSYCVGGGSNKHCLLTFFILFNLLCPSKYSPPARTHLFSWSIHFWKHFSNSSMGTSIRHW